MRSNFSFQHTAAWGVHLFTSTGILAGFMALLAISEHQWRAAAFWLIICQIIDGVDGTFARLFRVKEVLPVMDGKNIDQVIDFATYAILPAYFFYEAGMAPDSWRLACVFAMLLAAAMYYGKEGMISEDMHFIGFPVMWNVVVYFLFFVYDFPLEINGLIVFIFAFLHFVPLRYPYPSRMLEYQKFTLLLSSAALFSAVGSVWIFPEKNLWLAGMVTVAILWYAFLTYRSSFRAQSPVNNPL